MVVTAGDDVCRATAGPQPPTRTCSSTRRATSLSAGALKFLRARRSGRALVLRLHEVDYIAGASAQGWLHGVSFGEQLPRTSVGKV